jgi:hypothetical protein
VSKDLHTPRLCPPFATDPLEAPTDGFAAAPSRVPARSRAARASHWIMMGAAGTASARLFPVRGPRMHLLEFPRLSISTQLHPAFAAATQHCRLEFTVRLRRRPGRRMGACALLWFWNFLRRTTYVQRPNVQLEEYIGISRPTWMPPASDAVPLLLPCLGLLHTQRNRSLRRQGSVASNLSFPNVL